MAVIYVREQGACVHKSNLQLAVQKGKHILKKVPLSYVEQLAVFGNVQITTQLMQYLLQQGVEIHYFTYGGKYLGCSKGEHSRNIFLRCAQYELFADMEKRVMIARILVDGKIGNQIAVIRRHRWDSSEKRVGQNEGEKGAGEQRAVEKGTDEQYEVGKGADEQYEVGKGADETDCRGNICENYDWHADVESLEKQRRLLEKKESIEEIMGIEGMASMIYFRSYGQMFKSELRFCGRNRRPPRDPVNAVLSLTYTFLTRDMCSILDVQSFETYLGFLHGIRYGRKSLALDLIEVFRQPAADRLVLRLFNKQILTKYDFREDDVEGIYLNEDGFQKFCYEYEKWMTDKRNGDSWRTLMRRQAQMLKETIQYGTVFQAWKWE